MDEQYTIIENPLLRPRPSRNRLAFLTMAMISVLLLLASRSFYLQVVQGSAFRARAEGNRVAQLPLPAPRGLMYDRHHIQLTENISNTDLVFDPILLPAESNESYLIDALPALVPNLTAAHVKEILDRTRKTQRVTPLAKSIDHDTVLRLEESQDNIRGTRLASTLVRRYPFGEVLAHLVGYTGPVTAEEVSKDQTLLPTDSTGKSGLEKMYEKDLRGQHGVTSTEVDAGGRAQTDLGKVDPVSGQDLTLTLDVELQKFVYSLFSDKNEQARKDNQENVSGAAIVLDANTGGVLAAVSYPSYDPNAFSQPGLRRQTEHIFTDPGNPLFNRPIDGTYPSGSIIKPFLAAGALEEGIITEQTTVFSTGGIDVGPWHFADWKAGGHGITDVKKALAESVNTFFYEITGGYQGQAGLGVEKADHYLASFGWGQATGIDLPSEAKGFLPTPAWKAKTKGEQWYIGDTYHLGIGQGDVLVTPLQIGAATAALANEHYIPTPHLVDKSSNRRSLSISAHNLDIVRAGMRQAVESGSARSLNTLPIALAGKTGTAQIGGTDKTHAWFTSFGPYEKPEITVTVLLEKGGAGDGAAVPLAREIWKWWTEHGHS